jgi:predicted nucleic acid-binding protein
VSAYADASFLVSAFGKDAHTPTAIRWLRSFTEFPILVSRLTLLEADTALRAAVLGKRITGEEMTSALHGIHRALKEGFLVRREVPTHQWYPQAHRISAHDTHRSAARALDIMHVAAAVVLRAKGFLSFDDRQRELAEDEGLQVMP